MKLRTLKKKTHTVKVFGIARYRCPLNATAGVLRHTLTDSKRPRGVSSEAELEQLLNGSVLIVCSFPAIKTNETDAEAWYAPSAQSAAYVNRRPISSLELTTFVTLE